MRKWLLMLVAGYLWRKYSGARTPVPSRRPPIAPHA